MLNQEYVVLVNAQDEVLGLEEKLKAHELGLLHRAFSIFVFRRQFSTIEFLMQKRHKDKYHCGGLWTNTCCSHPRWGEDILEAGQRRLKEEMSITVPLRKIGSFQYRAEFDNGLIECELDHVLIGEFEETQTIHCNPLEVENSRWQSFPNLMDELALYKEHYTPWLKSALNIVQENLCLNY